MADRQGKVRIEFQHISILNSKCKRENAAAAQ
jgi:hypothetical protein